MRFDSKNIYFNEEERWISGLSEHMRLVGVDGALSQVLAARGKCQDSFADLLSDDIDTRDVADERKLAGMYIDRLDRINSLAQNLVPVVMPHIIGQIESNEELLREMAKAGSKQ